MSLHPGNESFLRVCAVTVGFVTQGKIISNLNFVDRCFMMFAQLWQTKVVNSHQYYLEQDGSALVLIGEAHMQFCNVLITEGIIMKKVAFIAAALALPLAACAKEAEDKVEDAYEDKADAMEETADTMTGPDAEAMEARADATEEMGDVMGDKVEDGKVDMSDAMPETPAQ